MWAQDAVPAGTLLPVALQSTVKSNEAKDGSVVTARVMQDVLTAHGVIRAGSKLIGHVVQGASTGNGSTLTLQFDKLRTGNHVIPVTTDLRALASYMEVEEAQIPSVGPDKGTPNSAWTTVQIGGDVVYRGGGPVNNGREDVGKPVAGGVLADVKQSPAGCRGATDGNTQSQALWVFSSDACGVYGIEHLRIQKKGRTKPVGAIILASEKGPVKLPSGTGMLLRVDGIPSNSAELH